LPAAGQQVGDDGYLAAVESARQAAAAYADAAARLARAAVPAAARVAAGQPAGEAELGAISPSAVLLSPQLHVPPVQFSLDRVPVGLRPTLVRLNADLAAHHEQLMFSIDRILASGVPATVFDPGPSAMECGRSSDVGGGFPTALHAFGADCAWAVMMLSDTATAR
jgi:hypothetical protein